MRALLTALALTACSPQPADIVAPSTDVQEQPPPAPALPSAAIDGWEIDQTAFAKLNTQLPAFSATTSGGATLTSESLRGRWTVLGLWGEGARPAEEAGFAAALNSAVDQDPDLDLLIVHRAGPAASEVWPWPLVIDDGKIATAIGAPASPAYLLVGPDLTIEGYRGALSATPEDGIKPVIRGVAEIRRQIADPL